MHAAGGRGKQTSSYLSKPVAPCAYAPGPMQVTVAWGKLMGISHTAPHCSKQADSVSYHTLH